MRKINTNKKWAKFTKEEIRVVNEHVKSISSGFPAESRA